MKSEKRFVYQATLLSDVSFSASNSTTQATTLDYVPGAALLGALASRHYGTDEALAWSRFHSGELRFGIGLPVTIHEPEDRTMKPGPDSMGVPFPHVGYTLKGVKAKVFSNAVRLAPAGQPEFKRGGYLDARGSWAAVPRRVSLRTKIERETGMAGDATLHMLECLPAGTRFIGQVSADADELLDFARKYLEGVHRIGRSRGAELGSVQIEVLREQAWLEHGPAQETSATFLCLSDVALRTTHGAVRLVPVGEDVGLPGWAFDSAKSSLRVRAYSPYNGHRRSFDSERQVIEMGSVLVFTGAGVPSGPQLHRALNSGVGEHRAEGLGQLWFEPEPLKSATVGRWAAIFAKEPATSGADPLNSPLKRWLEEQTEGYKRDDEMFGLARKAAQALRSVPRAQWSEVAALVGADGDLQPLKRFLQEGVRRKVWQYRWRALMGQLGATQLEINGTPKPGDPAYPQEPPHPVAREYRARFLQLIAQHARHASKQENR